MAEMQLPKMLGHSFAASESGATAAENCHGGNVNAFPFETLKSASAMARIPALPMLREMNSEFGAERQNPLLSGHCPERRSLIC